MRFAAEHALCAQATKGSRVQRVRIGRRLCFDDGFAGINPPHEGVILETASAVFFFDGSRLGGRLN